VTLKKRKYIIRATSITCLRSPKTNRALGGTFMYNIIHGDPRFNTVEEVMTSAIHEIFHAIFFDNELFDFYPKTSKGETPFFKNKFGTIMARSDTLLEVAKKHFNCN
jgi:hypothetical protein